MKGVGGSPPPPYLLRRGNIVDIDGLLVTVILHVGRDGHNGVKTQLAELLCDVQSTHLLSSRRVGFNSL